MTYEQYREMFLYLWFKYHKRGHRELRDWHMFVLEWGNNNKSEFNKM